MNFTKRFCLHTTLLLVVALLTQSAEPYVVNIRHVSVEDGLASREVFCGTQDSRGFIWFGTRSGLNRYDGKNYLLFTETNSGLRDDRTIQLAEDDRGYIWLMHGSLDRLNSFDTRIDILNTTNEQILPIAQCISGVPFTESQVVSFNRDDTGKMIIHLSNGEIFSWTLSGGFVKSDRKWIVDPQNFMQLVNGHAELLLEDSYTSANEGASIVLPLCRTSNAIYPALIYDMSRNQLTLNNISARDEISPVNFQYEKAVIPQGESINAITVLFDERSNSSIVQVTNKSVAYAGPGFYYELMSSADLARFPAFTPYSQFSDQQGNVWMCTNTGVFNIHSERNRFRTFFTSKDLSINNYEGNQARAIFEDSTGLYANIWDHLLVSRDSSMEKFQLGGIGYPLIKDEETIWTGGHSIVQLDLKSGAKKVVPLTDPKNIAWSVFDLNDSLLLYGCENGIYTFNKRTNELKEAGNAQRFPYPKFTYRFLRDDQGRILTASADGIYEIGKSGELLSYYGPTAADASHLFYFRDLHDIFQDRNGIYWLATNGNGIYRWDGVNTKHYTVADGLSSNLVYCVLEDNNGFIWLSSDYGLMRFDPATTNVKTFTTKNGLAHNEFNRTSAFRTTDGRMYFGGLNGIVGLNPNDFVDDTVMCNAPLQIVSYSQFIADVNQLIDMDSVLRGSGQIVLHPGDKFFTLEFMLLDFEESQHHYAYRIEGIDEDWVYTSENSIRFSDLPYGKFVLRIKAQNGEGEWSKSELALTVLVERPYYREGWFLGSSVFVSVLLFFGFIRWRTLSLRRDKIKLEAQVQERTEKLSRSLEEKEILLREIHHRVKNNLQIISGLLELQSSGIEDENAKAVLADSQNRVQSIALIHRELYQKDNLAAIEFQGFVTELFNQVFAVYRSSSREVVPEINLPKIYLDIDTAIPAGLIINELLVNSFKYAFKDGSPGYIRIELIPRVKDEFELSYTDSGPGIPKTIDITKSKSLGLRLVTRLAKQIGGTTEYIPGLNHRFIITFTNKIKEQPKTASYASN